jgi:pimeloyl-ACP methyl ester carboxylesterase
VLVAVAWSAGAANSASALEPPREAVVLLHGLARRSESMLPLADRFLAAGYEVHNLDYPSTKGSPGELVAVLREEFLNCCASAPRVHFVTHSLGGILTRIFLIQSQPTNLGRVVMIAPPNHGSEIVDLLGGLGLFRRWFGPTAVALRTDATGLTQKLSPPEYEVGIIAGDWPVNPLGAMVIPGRDDGGVSLEGTRMPGMADFLTVHRSHSFITRAPEVAEQAVHFLKTGSFDHPHDPEVKPQRVESP